MKQPRSEVFNRIARLFRNDPDIVAYWDAAVEDELKRLAYADDFKVAQGRVQVMVEIQDLLHKAERVVH